MDVRGVLFDFGYTLFAHATLVDTISGCAARLGVALDDDRAIAVARRIDAAAMAPDELAHPRDYDAMVWAERWRLLYGIADEVVTGLGDSLFESMHDPMAWVPYQDTASTLRTLRAAGLPVGIVSNTGWDVRAAFVAHGVAAEVDAFTLSYECGAVKPSPEIFTSACASIDVEAEHVLMVGDDPRSDGGAATAGIRTLLLPARAPGTDNDLAAVLRLATGA